MEFEYGLTKRIGTLFGIPFPVGDLRARETLGEMKKLAITGQALPIVKQYAERITAGCENDTCRIKALYSFAKQHVRFRNDPPIWIRGHGFVESEVLYRPEYMLKIISRQDITTGDCDDSSTLLVTLCLAAGMRAGWIAVETGLYPGKLDHVYAVVYNRDLKAWRSIDVATTRTDWTGQRYIKTELKPMVTTNFGKGFSAGEGATPPPASPKWWEVLIPNASQTIMGLWGRNQYPGAGGGYPYGAPPQVQAAGAFNLDSTSLLIFAGVAVALLATMGRR